MTLPNMIVMDYETGLTTGEPSLDFYRPDFRVKSCAFAWRDDNNDIKTFFTQSTYEINKFLKKIEIDNIPVVVHNLAFEYGVTLNAFPDVNLNWAADTMRMAQVADNGGVESEFETSKSTGLSLSAVAKRWLPNEHHNHKEPFYKFLRDNHGIKPKQEGANLHLLTPDMLEEYNTADTKVTLLICETLLRYFNNNSYDFKPDHALYISAAKLISESRNRGVRIDRGILEKSSNDIKSSLEASELEFFNKFDTHIKEIEAEKTKALIGSRKSQKGQEKAAKDILETPDLVKFNVSSSKDMEALFVHKLGKEAKFLTPKGKPSFAKQFLGQWGEGGNLLSEKGTLTLTLNQCESLLKLSYSDSKWHIDLMSAGTTTGRFKGTGGLNIQAMARKDSRLMSAIIPESGNIFISADLSAGEPTIITEFSKDPYYFAATFGMVGKTPSYDDRNVLLIDDIYLMGMSVSPMGKERMLRAFYEEKFNGLSFSEAWVSHPDLVKSQLKKERAFHKILILGLGYSMGPKHMVESAFKAGYELSLKDAKAFFKAYWNLFSEVKQLGKKLERHFTEDGALINSFGYRLIPNPSYKCLNYFIQSSVSGLINALCSKFFTVCPEAKFVTVIHDEIIFEIPENSKEECRILFNEALKSLNEDLDWSVKVRCGWVEGRNLYEAK